MSRAVKKSDLELLMERIERFQKKQFPDSTFESKVKHLREELTEWRRAPDDETEMADVFILAIAAAAKLGYTARNIIAIAHRKMDVNEQSSRRARRKSC